MIELSCTTCKTVLQIDDGFAGGVCRCQHCGTIQTVPAHLRPGATRPRGATRPARALYRSPGDTASGLDQLAEIVGSTGLTSSGLSPRPSESKPARSPRVDRWLLITVILEGIIILLLLGIITGLLMRH